MYELIYTSARQGILPGRSGFSTVACTIGIPPNLISPIENLCAYKPLFSVGDPQAGNNPVSISGRIFTFGQTRYQIISRTGFAGADYTGRTNKISHHFILPMEEHLLDDIPGGMLAIAMSEENFQTEWKNTDPKWLNPRQNVMMTPVLPGLAVTWGKYMGDPRWAGLAAAAYHEDPTGSLYVEYPLGMPVHDLLKLFSEIVIQLPLEEQLSFTFDTYAFQTGISASGCFLRAVPEGTSLLDNIRRHRPEELISLTEKKTFPEYYADNPFVQSAQGEALPAEDKINNTLILKPLQDEEPGPVHLQSVISQEKPDDLPLEPVQKMAPKSDRTGENESGNYKLLFFLSLILLTLCIIMLVFQYIMNADRKAVPATPTEQEDAIQTISPSPMNEQALPIEKIPKKTEVTHNEKAAENKKVAKPKQPVAVPVKKKPMQAAVAVKKTSFPIRQKLKGWELNGAERIYLFSKFYLEKQGQILLPARLRKCKKIAFKFSKIGEYSVKESELSQYRAITDSGMKVFAVSATRNHSKMVFKPFRESYFSMEIQDGQIVIQDINTDYTGITHRFTIGNIKEIEFEGEKGGEHWNCQLILDEDVKHIKSGKLVFNDHELIYIGSPEEKLFEKEFALSSGKKCYLEIKFCGLFNLSKINSLILDWNKNLIECNKIQKSYEKSSKEYAKMRKECIVLQKGELERLNHTKKAFTQEQLEKIKKHWLFNVEKGRMNPSKTEADLYRKLQRQNNPMYQEVLRKWKVITEIKGKISQEKLNITKKRKKLAEIKKRLSDYGIQDIVRDQDMEQITSKTSAGKKLFDAVNRQITRYFVTKE